jgi:excinuclease ABC subunit C
MIKIKQILKEKNIPSSPGIYKMIDNNNNILYIGKAKSLKNRLNSYCNSNQNLKNIAMLNLIEKIEFIQTKTEIHALLLEATYIRDIKPKYNIILKDDRSFSYLYFSNDKFSSILVRKKFKEIENKEIESKEIKQNTKKQIQNKKNENKESFFGPFYNRSSAVKMLEIIKNNFKIRDCSNITFNNRNSPCIEYHIGKCSAPCVNKVTLEDYQKDILNAKKFLQGEKKTDLIKEYKKQMLEASKNENYILAKSYQEKIKFLNEISSDISSKYNNFDLITFIEKNNKIVLCYAVYRSSILMDKVFNIINKSENYENEISINVENFYKNNKTPEVIFLAKSMINITFQQN